MSKKSDAIENSNEAMASVKIKIIKMLAASVSSKTSRTEERNQSSRKKVGAPLVRKLQENL